MREFIRRLLREQPLRFVAVVVASAAAGLLEGVGVASVVPLLEMVSDKGPGNAATGTVGRAMKGVLEVLGLPFTLVTVLGFALSFVLAQQIVLLFQQKLAQGTIFRFEAGLRTRAYRAVFSADWPFFLREKTAGLVNSLTMEAQRAAHAYQYLNVMLGILIVVTVYLSLAFVLSWQMTLVVLVVAAVAATLLRGRISRAATFGEAITELNSELTREASEYIAGAKVIKGFGVERAAVTRFRSFVNRLANQQYRLQMNQAWLRVFYDSVSIVTVFAGIYVAVTVFEMDFAHLVVFMFIFYRLSPRLSNLQSQAHWVVSYLPALARIDEVVASAEGAAERAGGAPVPPLAREVALDDVDFAYGPDTPDIVAGLSLSIPRGMQVAIVGPSGSGKTTVVDILMGLLSPTRGRVVVDGEDLQGLDLSTWRARIGYVAQDSAFFHATVEENIALMSEGAARADVAAAAGLAHADGFVGELPEGYETVIGDRGVRLSGGQRQRLALARALVRRPELLILDEATSALDAESEKAIQDAIRSLAGSVTVVVVTHRLATVKDADLIYVLDGGRLVETGTFAELMEAGGVFARSKRLQDLEVRDAGTAQVRVEDDAAPIEDAGATGSAPARSAPTGGGTE